MFIIKGVTAAGKVIFYEGVAGNELGYVNIHERYAFKFKSLDAALLIKNRLNSSKAKPGIRFDVFQEPLTRKELIEPSPFHIEKVNIHFSDEDIESAYLSSGWWRMASRIRDQVNKMNSEVRP